MTTHTEPTEVTVVIVPASEYDSLRTKVRWLLITALVLMLVGIILAPFFGWTFTLIGLSLALFTYFFNMWATERLLCKYGWDGTSYPLKVVREHQSFVHD